MRLLPGFIIIGAQRCGTTSLFNYLTQHPDVYPSCPKEVQYFSNYYGKGMSWYRSHFPLAWHKRYIERNGSQGFITGEATPYYLAHPYAPRRAAEAVPQSKLIVLLRNPVDRAYSHYHYEVKMGAETLSFEDAIDTEEERLSAEVDKMFEDDSYRSFNFQHFTYLSRGIYVDQLERWTEFFNREQILVLGSETFYEDPPTTLKQVLEFLNLADWRFRDYKKFNIGHYSEMDTRVKERLEAYFEPHNQRLYEFLDMDFDWGKP